jgi:hypothetical protein
MPPVLAKNRRRLISSFLVADAACSVGSRPMLQPLTQTGHNDSMKSSYWERRIFFVNLVLGFVLTVRAKAFLLR